MQFNIILELCFILKYDIQLLEDSMDHFRSWDEDDYIAPGTPITLDIKRVCYFLYFMNQPSDFKQHHQLVIQSLQNEITPRFLNSIKGDKGQTMVYVDTIIDQNRL